jgi:hypothetical protein
MRTRRRIVSARIRIVVFGHLLLFGVGFVLQSLGMLGGLAGFLSVSMFSLLVISAWLFLFEFVHVKMLPRMPPKFVIRGSGVTEYDEEGPRVHWDWNRTRLLSIETDRVRPQYRFLVLKMSETVFLEKLSRVYIPLPENVAASGGMKVDETSVVAAIARALEENGIEWKSKGDGTLALSASNTK